MQRVGRVIAQRGMGMRRMRLGGGVGRGGMEQASLRVNSGREADHDDRSHTSNKDE